MFFPKPIAFLLSVLLSFIWLRTNNLDAATLPQNEVDVLNRIAKTMGSNDRNFEAGSCNVSDKVDLGAVKNITCTCRTTPATLRICNDFAYNYLNGSIPLEWASMQLEYIDLEANQFSGQVPPEIGKLVNLRTL
ncbi:hypothetical protein Gogos_008110 [Gossypium gossypioides]|uniref:Leucine-rich repeat-containing N-terminal plant-type domain-containing protein n=1 Tax=Gossypium gossypioides TaxID=34282 RepID=A0A7J9CAP7_GOSGO|nr:hypothetical protein [Gossypium gossypioides]